MNSRHISAGQSRFVSSLLAGEGWHNYHHSFPWDYRAAEIPSYLFNTSTAFIEFFAWIGWATNLRTASDEIVQCRSKKHGDGSYKSPVQQSSFTEDDNNNVFKQ